MSETQGKMATGGIFGLLQNALSDEQYGKLKAEFPEADQLATTSQQTDGDGDGSIGGLMGAAMGALSGGGSSGNSNSSTTDITSLVAKLAGHGITPQQIQQFLPLAAPYIQQMTGVDIGSMLGLSPSSGGSTGGGGGGVGNSAMDMLSSLTGSSSAVGSSTGDNSNPLGSVMGMFGK